MWSKLDNTVYYFCGANQQLKFILALQVDYYMYTGTEAEMKSFEDLLGSIFDDSKFACGTLKLMGCRITRQDDGSIKYCKTLCYQSLMKTISLTLPDQKETERPALSKWLYTEKLL